MRSPVSIVLIGAALLALTACTTDQAESSSTTAANARPDPAPGGVTRRGETFAMMSEQYRPRAGSSVATGASAWVRPAPAPAFIASGPPPAADPPAPDPIQAAISQSSASASAVARPEAGAPDPAVRTAGLTLFNTYACGTCHTFADAGATGSIGPSLDRNPTLSKALAVDLITHGRGAMPSFAGQMTDAEIAALADYLVAHSRK